jgi:hypothetical protein
MAQTSIIIYHDIYFHNHPVRLLLSVVVQCFSLTTKQPQSAYKPQKQPAEQGEYVYLMS